METAFDIISLVLFIVVILLAFFRKVNVGVVQSHSALSWCVSSA